MLGAVRRRILTVVVATCLALAGLIVWKALSDDRLATATPPPISATNAPTRDAPSAASSPVAAAPAVGREAFVDAGLIDVVARLVYEDGSPAAALSVAAEPAHASSLGPTPDGARPRLSTTSNDLGVAHFALPADVAWSARIGPDVGVAETPDNVFRTGPFAAGSREVRVVVPGFALRLRAVDEAGAPVAGRTFAVRRYDDPHAPRDGVATTDADGRAVLWRRAAGSVIVEDADAPPPAAGGAFPPTPATPRVPVRFEGEAPWDEIFERGVRCKAKFPGELTVVLRRLTAVRVRAVDAEGRPHPRAFVEASAVFADSADRFRADHGVAADDGRATVLWRDDGRRFAVGATPVSVRCDVSAREGGPTESVERPWLPVDGVIDCGDVVVPPDVPKPPAAPVALPERAELVVRVENARGEPLAGVEVKSHRDHASWSVARSDAEGAALFRNVDVGTWTIGVPEAQDAWKVEVRAPRTEFTARLRPTRVVEAVARVRDATREASSDVTTAQFSAWTAAGRHLARESTQAGEPARFRAFEDEAVRVACHFGCRRYERWAAVGTSRIEFELPGDALITVETPRRRARGVQVLSIEPLGAEVRGGGLSSGKAIEVGTGARVHGAYRLAEGPYLLRMTPTDMDRLGKPSPGDVRELRIDVVAGRPETVRFDG
jgi:hypothetical protein